MSGCIGILLCPTAAKFLSDVQRCLFSGAALFVPRFSSPSLISFPHLLPSSSSFQELNNERSERDEARKQLVTAP